MHFTIDIVYYKNTPKINSFPFLMQVSANDPLPFVIRVT